MMTPRDRVLGALDGLPADPIPWIEHGMDCRVVAEAYGLSCAPAPAPNASRLEEHLDGQRFACLVNEATGRCNIEIPYHYTMAPRVYVPGTSNGALTDESSLDQLVFVELTPRHWDDMQRLINAKGDYAISVSISTGIGHIWQTMDLTAFAVACLENHKLLRAILQRYTDWTCRVLQKVNAMGVDFVWSFDDFAFKTGTFYSPEILREVILPYARQVAAEIKRPWIFHSDGNFMAVLDDIVPLGMNALNPLEHGCMDVEAIRKRYPNLTLVGNMDVNLLAEGAPEQVRAFVRRAFRLMNRNHRYIPASGNSIPAFARPANVRAMIEQIWECAGVRGNLGRVK
jgi:hypothetical protein